MTKRFIAVAVILPLAITAALAQSDPDTSGSYVSKEVVITTTRSPEPLLTTPMAISTVRSAEFEHDRGYELKEALWSVPGVFVQSRSGHTDVRITIRGYGARGAGNRSNAGNMRGIRVLVDGVPETEPDGRTSLDLIDLATTSRLEVLRSNASTLYGSASGGVINLFSNLEFNQPFAATRNVFGSYGFLRNVVQAGAVFGASNLLVSVTNGKYDGYRDHSGASQFLADAAFTSLLDSATRFGLYASATSNLFRFPGPLSWAEFQADPLQANKAFKDRDERRYNRQGKVAMRLDHGFGGGHEASALVYLQPKVLERSERNTYRDFNRYGIGSQAIYRWQTAFSDAIDNRFSAGFDQQYQDGTVLFYSLGPGGSRGDTVRQNKQEGAITIGGFVEETITLDDAWQLRVGARYDRISYIYRNFLKPGSSLAPQRIEYEYVTPKAAISYRVAPGHALYASYGGGVEAPAFNEVDPPSDSLIRARGGTPDKANADFNPTLEPTRSTSIELGARGVLPLDGPVTYLSYDVAGYMIDLKNDLVPWAGGAYYFTAAETRRRGVELGLSAGSTMGLTLTGAVTVASNTYEEYENQLGRFDGNETAGLPGLFANARLRYDAPLGFFVEGSLEHVGSYYADDRNDKLADGSADPKTISLVPAYTLFGATAGWRGDLGPLGLDVFAGLHNLTDIRYVSSVFINADANQYFEPGMPRNFVAGIVLKYR